MGWMHDTLAFMELDPVHRGYHLNELTFSLLYAYTRTSVLPYSMTRSARQTFTAQQDAAATTGRSSPTCGCCTASCRKSRQEAAFMSSNSDNERMNSQQSVDWHLLEYRITAACSGWLRDLNARVSHQPSMHEVDVEPSGFDGSTRATQHVAVGLCAAAGHA